MLRILNAEFVPQPVKGVSNVRGRRFNIGNHISPILPFKTANIAFQCVNCIFESLERFLNAFIIQKGCAVRWFLVDIATSQESYGGQ
ncbi:MAG TPA: hypothetical protein VKV05_07300 [Terriglobales bacterium]|nr:hypothetical protein [Terriglobales bacterium]